MARLHHVKKARRDYKEHGIRKGESYFWWKFRFGGKRMSKTRPRRSQLTQSEFMATMMDAEDDLAATVQDFNDSHDFKALADALEELSERIRTTGEEQEEKRSNMPDSLQDSETGSLLEQRAEACEGTAQQLEDAAGAILELADEENEDEACASAVSEAEGVSWDY